MKKTVITNQTSLFGEELVPASKSEVEYFMLLSPDARVKEEIKQFKQMLHAEFTMIDENMHSVPHISLLAVTFNYAIDDIMKYKLNTLYRNESAFRVMLKGFDFFPGRARTETLYASIQNESEVSLLQQKTLRAFNKKGDGLKPHLTVARNIMKARYEKSLVALNKMNFESSFYCSHITVLKRVIENKIPGKYQLFYEVPLKK